MASPFQVEVVTPDGVVYQGDVQSLQLPGTDGSFGILARHAPLLAALEVGVAKVVDPSGTAQMWALGEGFVEVSRQSTKILTDFADEGGGVDRQRAEAAEKRARERLASRAADLDRVRAEAALHRAMARLKVLR
jgi:F-type H+-transporting ATPase subunit epsilon